MWPGAARSRYGTGQRHSQRLKRLCRPCLAKPFTLSPSPFRPGLVARAICYSRNKNMNNKTPLILLAMVSALGPMAIDMGLPALPALEQGFGLTTGQGALTLTVFLLGFGLSPVLSGLLSDRFGRKRVLTVSLFAFSLLALLCSLAESYTWLLIFRMLQGIFAGASVALPIAIIRDQVSEARAGPYIAKIAMIVGLAPIVAPALGTLVLTFSGWRGIYLTQAGLGLALTAWSLGSLSDRPDFTPGRFAGIASILRNARAVYGNRGFLLPTLTYATLFSAMFSFLAAAPAVFIKGFGFSEFQLIFRSEEHTSELQSRPHLVCRLLLEKKKK